MLGAIAGDVIGSKYEFKRTKQFDFELIHAASTYTDDTVLTVATADEILNPSNGFGVRYAQYAKKHPDRGYGGMFKQWYRRGGAAPAYNSFGNGSGMRVSPVGWAFKTEAEVLDWAKKSAEVTHNHPEGIKGAQAIAWCIWAARQAGTSMDDIQNGVTEKFGYDLSKTPNEIRPTYAFDATCQGSVPEAIICFLNSHGWEEAVRNAVSLGGDADTIGCMTGSIAEAKWGVPEEIRLAVWKKLPPHLAETVRAFVKKYVDEELAASLPEPSPEDLKSLMGSIFST